MRKTSTRAFLAFDIDRRSKQFANSTMSSLSKQIEDVPVRWVNIKNSHVTLQFFGELTPDKIQEISHCISFVTRNYHSFALSFENLGGFPDLKKPRVLWLGLDGNLKELNKLHRDLLSKLKKYDVVDGKEKFVPHLTLGRVQSMNKKRSLMGAVKKVRLPESRPTFIVDRLVLYKSELQPSGPRYSVVKEFPLQEAV